MKTEGWHKAKEAQECVKQWDAGQEGSCFLPALLTAWTCCMIAAAWVLEHPWKLLVTLTCRSCLISVGFVLFCCCLFVYFFKKLSLNE